MLLRCFERPKERKNLIDNFPPVAYKLTDGLLSTSSVAHFI